MKRNNISIRAAVAAMGALCGAMMLPALSQAAGVVTVNGGQVCVSSTSMSLNPAGDIVINCTAASNGDGAPTTAPSCTVNVSPAAITTGQSSNISAVCNPAATSYAWTASASAPTVSGSGASVPFPTAGTYTYSVTGTNNIGAGAASPGVSVVVSAASTSGSCANPKPVNGSFTGNGIKNLAIDRGGSVSYQVPVYTAARTLEILSVQSTSSQSDLTSEFSVSECPGDFDTVPAECKTWGTVNQSGTQLYAAVSSAPIAGACTAIIGKTYYINVRNTKFDRVTPACTPQTCYMILQLNSF